MQGVAVIPQRHSAVGRHVVNVDILVDVNDEFALRVDLDEDLLLVHGLDDLPDIAALFLQQLQLLSQKAHCKRDGVSVTGLRG